MALCANRWHTEWNVFKKRFLNTKVFLV